MAIEIELSDTCCMQSLGSKRLQQIAEALGTSVDALSAPSYPYVLHSSEDGTSWVLIISADGIPFIRHVYNENQENYITEENLHDFISNNKLSQQYKSLMKLINNLLISHIMMK